MALDWYVWAHFSITPQPTDPKLQIEKLFDVACTLTDVMSCVPMDTTFEYGPRDYLSQLMSLISTLRGGRERYIPLLMTKINSTMPSMPMLGYALPPASGARLEDLYDGSQTHSSAPNSGESSPFCSPPLSSEGAGTFGLPEMTHLPILSNFPAGISNGVPYADLTVSGSMEMYQDPVMQGYAGPGPPTKYETG